MEGIPEKKILGTVKDFELRDGRFPEVLEYKGWMYDLREILPDGTGWYRMTNEARIAIDEAPNFIEVSKNGAVIQERD